MGAVGDGACKPNALFRVVRSLVQAGTSIVGTSDVVNLHRRIGAVVPTRTSCQKWQSRLQQAIRVMCRERQLL